MKQTLRERVGGGTENLQLENGEDLCARGERDTDALQEVGWLWQKAKSWMTQAMSRDQPVRTRRRCKEGLIQKDREGCAI